MFICRGFGRQCQCELSEGDDPNMGDDQCPLVKLPSWLSVCIYIYTYNTGLEITV